LETRKNLAVNQKKLHEAITDTHTQEKIHKTIIDPQARKNS
jgi:hypothetical protein